MAASSVFFMHARYSRNEFAWNIKDPSEANFKQFHVLEMMLFYSRLAPDLGFYLSSR